MIGKMISPVTWAQYLLANGCVIVDVETTGTDTDAEILSLAAIDHKGNILQRELVRPKRPIDESGGAFRVNKISNAMVAGARPWPHVWLDLKVLLEAHGVIAGRTPLVGYNVGFDWRMVVQSSQLYWEDVAVYAAKIQLACAMDQFGSYQRMLNPDARKRYKLADACKMIGAPPREFHREDQDCLAVLDLLRYMADRAIDVAGDWKSIPDLEAEVNLISRFTKPWTVRNPDESVL